jgi:hypothetical protein
MSEENRKYTYFNEQRNNINNNGTACQQIKTRKTLGHVNGRVSQIIIHNCWCNIITTNVHAHMVDISNGLKDRIYEES